MFRKPLRTQNGCDRCRTRRKKCDEVQPTCDNCTRLNLACTWNRRREKQTHTAQPNDVETLSRTLPKSVGIKLVPRSVSDNAAFRYGLGPGYRSFRDQTQFDLTVWSPTALQGLVSSSAASRFQDTSMLLTVGLQYDWLRDALAAFSAYSLLTISKEDKKWQRIAVQMYNKALSAVRAHIRASQPSAATLETLVAVTFLGLSESLGEGDASQAIVHFSAAAAICRSMPFAAANTAAGRRLYQIAVECWLYNLTTLALLHPDCDAIEKCIDWTVLEDCFQALSADKKTSLSRSPFLGGNHDIYRITFQMTCYARKQSCASDRQTQWLAWTHELDSIQHGLTQYHTVLPPQVANLYHSKFVLHILSLRIFLDKIADHELSASSAAVQAYLQTAQGVFNAQSTQEKRNPALAWPLTIFLCAADDDQMFGFFINTINEIRDNFDTGHARRMSAVLAIIKQHRAQNLETLDLLLRKNGILVPDDAGTPSSASASFE